MKSFSEERFPTNISYGISGGPCFKTDVVTTNSGHEYRNICHIHPRYKYQLASAIKTEDQLSQIVSFFRAMLGKAIAFRFKDWLDYKGEFEWESDGEQYTFQLYKIYETGSLKTQRKITKPVEGTVSIDNIERFAVNYTTGEVTLKEPLEKGTKIKVKFEFDVPVRFDSDTIVTTMQNYGVQLVEDISLIEVYL